MIDASYGPTGNSTELLLIARSSAARLDVAELDKLPDSAMGNHGIWTDVMRYLSKHLIRMVSLLLPAASPC